MLGTNGGTGVTTHGGGSGHVTPTYTVTPLQGLTERFDSASPKPPANASAQCSYETGTANA